MQTPRRFPCRSKLRSLRRPVTGQALLQTALNANPPGAGTHSELMRLPRCMHKPRHQPREDRKGNLQFNQDYKPSTMRRLHGRNKKKKEKTLMWLLDANTLLAALARYVKRPPLKDTRRSYVTGEAHYILRS